MEVKGVGDGVEAMELPPSIREASILCIRVVCFCVSFLFIKGNDCLKKKKTTLETTVLYPNSP